MHRLNLMYNCVKNGGKLVPTMRQVVSNYPANTSIIWFSECFRAAKMLKYSTEVLIINVYVFHSDNHYCLTWYSHMCTKHIKFKRNFVIVSAYKNSLTEINQIVNEFRVCIGHYIQINILDWLFFPYPNFNGGVSVGRGRFVLECNGQLSLKTHIVRYCLHNPS